MTSPIDVLRGYIAPFVDIGTELRVAEERDGTIELRGCRHSEEFILRVRSSEAAGRFDVIQGGKRERRVPLIHTLASGRFAHLDALANNQLRHLTQRLGGKGGIVESRVQDVTRDEIELADGDPDGPRDARPPMLAVQAIHDGLSSPGRSGTRLTFLHGDAGAGKSWILMAAARTQAQAYLTRQSPRLYLYIDAQGVNLRSLEQQLARQLDLYGGGLRYSEVVPLARLGLLGLIIDGFDELIMPSGYNDTLGALCAYLSDFRGEGSVVASARTAFFRNYDLRKAGVRMTQPIDSSVLKMLPWEEAERREFCRLNGCAQVHDRMEAISASGAAMSQLLGRPFIVAETAKLLLSGGLAANEDLLPAVESAFVERERTLKLLDPDRSEPLLSSAQLYTLLSELASEMWHLRQTSIDLEALRTVVAVLADGWGIRRDMKDMLFSKLESNPLLEPVRGEGGGERRVQFPHEIMFARFFCRSLVSELRSASASTVTATLSRAPLAPSMKEQFAGLARESVGERTRRQMWQETLGLLFPVAERVLGSDEGSDVVRANLGALVVGLLCVRSDQTPITIPKCAFDRVTFEGARLRDVTFYACRFGDVDARGADWSGAKFQEVEFIDRLEVSDAQTFPPSLPALNWLIIHRADRTDEYFGSRDTRRALFGAETAEPVASAPMSATAEGLWRLLGKLARRALRVFWVSVAPQDGDDGGSYRMKSDPLWPELLRILEANRLLQRAAIQRAGVDGDVVRVEQADAILSGMAGGGSPPPSVVRALAQIRAQ